MDLKRSKKVEQTEQMTVASWVLPTCWEPCCLSGHSGTPLTNLWAVCEMYKIKIPTLPLQLFIFLKYFNCGNFPPKADSLSSNLDVFVCLFVSPGIKLIQVSTVDFDIEIRKKKSYIYV